MINAEMQAILRRIEAMQEATCKAILNLTTAVSALSETMMDQMEAMEQVELRLADLAARLGSGDDDQTL